MLAILAQGDYSQIKITLLIKVAAIYHGILLYGPTNCVSEYNRRCHYYLNVGYLSFQFQTVFDRVVFYGVCQIYKNFLSGVLCIIMSIFNELLPKLSEISNTFTKNFDDDLKVKSYSGKL